MPILNAIFQSIPFKVLSVITVLYLAITAMLLVMGYTSTKRITIESDARIGHYLAHTLALAVEPASTSPVKPEPRAYVQSLIENMATGSFITDIAVISKDGKVLGKTGTRPLVPMTDYEVQKTLAQGMPSDSLDVSTLTETFFHPLGLSAADENKPRTGATGLLYLTIDLRPDIASLREAVSERTLIAVLFYLLIAAAVYYVIQRSVLTRTWALALQAERLGRGDFTARSGFPKKEASGDNIHQLADVFDTMAEQLEKGRAQQERIASELRQAERKYRTIFENAVEGIFQTSPNGRYISANPALARMMGFDSPDDLMTSRTDIAAQNYVDPALRDEFKRTIEKHGAIVGFEYQVYRKDGKIIWVSENGAIVRDDQGVPLHFEGTVVDITERKRMEQALLSSESRFRALIEKGPDTIAILNRHGVFTYVSPSILKNLGYAPEELLGTNGLALVHPDDREVVDQAFQRLRDNPGGTFRHEERFRNKDSSWRFIDIIGYNMLVEPGVEGIVYICRDVTHAKLAEHERAGLEAKVQQTQKLESLGILAGGIAHDFNNLLTGILGHADLALIDLSPMSPAREHLEQIVTASRRAAELAKQMLAYSGRGKLVVQPINMSEIVKEMAHLLEVSISKNCVLNFRFAPGLPSFMGDVTQIRQVIMNLIINASESIGDASGVVAIDAGAMECDHSYFAESYLDDDLPPGLYVYFEVADTGCGMTEEVISRLFDPFFTTKFTGRGLGMAAVLGIVRGHHGAIRVRSQAGRGTTVRVVFPAVETADANKEQQSSVSPAWRASGLLLVVDDDVTIRTLAKQMLERVGFEILTAADGREAVEVFRANATTFRAVLLDMTMPHMDGAAAFRELRQIRADIPVILSSGFTEHEALSRFDGHGLSAFIQKPYSTHELLSCIRLALENAPSSNIGTSS